VAIAINHWEITGPDAGALQTFYGELFGWQINADNEWQYGLVQNGIESGVSGGIGPEYGGGHRVSIYLKVDDLQGYLDKATVLGAEVVMPPSEVAGVNIALFKDPAGNVTGLILG
jgi:predicted enzyme related to lactoylglutathione lyase